jgi:ankyrin repeat protein
MTPLAWAATKGSLPFVRLFLKHGADPNLANDNGVTPLMCSKNTVAMARCLIEHGADPNQKNKWGETASEFIARIAPREGAKVVAYLRPLENGQRT